MQLVGILAICRPPESPKPIQVQPMASQRRRSVVALVAPFAVLWHFWAPEVTGSWLMSMSMEKLFIHVPCMLLLCYKKSQESQESCSICLTHLHDVALFFYSLCFCQGSPLAFAFFGSDKEDPVDRTKRLLREADAVFFDVDSTWNRMVHRFIHEI